MKVEGAGPCDSGSLHYRLQSSLRNENRRTMRRFFSTTRLLAFPTRCFFGRRASWAVEALWYLSPASNSASHLE